MAKSTRRSPNKVVNMPRAASTAPALGQSTKLTEAEIARRAFEIYCERGRQDGRDVEDWLQAERELRKAASYSAA